MPEQHDRPQGTGPRFQFDTKYYRAKPPQECSWSKPVPPFKRYADPIAELELPQPQTAGGKGIWDTIRDRRSQRRYLDEPMSVADLSQLLWATQGITGEGDPRFRATASAGALHPHDTYLVVNRVEGFGPGIAHYDIRQHRLALIKQGECGAQCAEACLGQRFCSTAEVVFAWGAVVDRTCQKYGDRGYRYLHLDAGHIGAHLQLATSALGLGSVNIGAFLDDEVNDLFGLDGVEQFIIYLTAVGKPT